MYEEIEKKHDASPRPSVFSQRVSELDEEERRLSSRRPSNHYDEVEQMMQRLQEARRAEGWRGDRSIDSSVAKRGGDEMGSPRLYSKRWFDKSSRSPTPPEDYKSTRRSEVRGSSYFKGETSVGTHRGRDIRPIAAKWAAGGGYALDSASRSKEDYYTRFSSELEGSR